MISAKSVVVIALMAITLLVLTACGSRNQGPPPGNEGDNAAVAVEAQQEVADEEVVRVAEAETHDVNEETAADHEDSDEPPKLHQGEDVAAVIHVEDAVAEGLEIFRSSGCAGCHGMNGEGILGPAMAGHIAEQIHNQVRMPVNSMQFKDANDNPIVMPAIPEDVISDEQLDLIATWVESLGPATGEHAHTHGEHMPMAPALVETGEVDSSVPAEAEAHLRLAFFAIHDGDIHDAGHHLADLIAGLEDGEAKEQAKLILTNLGSDADLHEIQDLVVAMVPNADTSFGTRFHLQLVMDSLSLDDLDRAQHHLEHFIELTSGVDKIKARETQMLLAEGDMHEVGHIIEELMGMAPHADH